MGEVLEREGGRLYEEPHVLIVDDERAFVTRLKEQVEAMACTVTWVTTAEDCLQAVGEKSPAVIVLTDVLGQVSGLNLCNALKRDAELEPIPVVVMSRRSPSMLAEHKTLPTRANVYVQKTDDMHDLLEEVRAIAEQHRRFERARLQPPPSSALSSWLPDPVAPEAVTGDASLPFRIGPDLTPELSEPPPAGLRVAPSTMAPEPGETLEVFYEPQSEPAPELDPAALRAEIRRLEQALAAEQNGSTRRILELEDEVAYLERTVEAQAAHIGALEKQLEK